MGYICVTSILMIMKNDLEGDILHKYSFPDILSFDNIINSEIILFVAVRWIIMLSTMKCNCLTGIQTYPNCITLFKINLEIIIIAVN